MTHHSTKEHEYPTSYCQWVVTEDGSFVEWDGNEKFYEAMDWMQYIIDNFLGLNPAANLDFSKGHTLNGQIEAQGEEEEDQWSLVVKDNKVSGVYPDEIEY